VYTENGLLVDLAEVEKVVDLCDVFTVVFGLFAERLLVDTRCEGEEGPLVALVEPVASVEERFFWLGQRRPAFGPPERFMFFLCSWKKAASPPGSAAAARPPGTRRRWRCLKRSWPSCGRRNKRRPCRPSKGRASGLSGQPRRTLRSEPVGYSTQSTGAWGGSVNLRPSFFV
jgi:hypothetical protein